ncbi:MAG: hypothetical protein NTX61_14145 [Bacteroidetes bacterium]|nr:hypothetical protein [Bacteroidota bacterium]
MWQAITTPVPKRRPFAKVILILLFLFTTMAGISATGDKIISRQIIANGEVILVEIIQGTEGVLNAKFSLGQCDTTIIIYKQSLDIFDNLLITGIKSVMKCNGKTISQSEIDKIPLGGIFYSVLLDVLKPPEMIPYSGYLMLSKNAIIEPLETQSMPCSRAGLLNKYKYSLDTNIKLIKVFLSHFNYLSYRYQKTKIIPFLSDSLINSMIIDSSHSFTTHRTLQNIGEFNKIWKKYTKREIKDKIYRESGKAMTIRTLTGKCIELKNIDSSILKRENDFDTTILKMEDIFMDSRDSIGRSIKTLVSNMSRNNIESDFLRNKDTIFLANIEKAGNISNNYLENLIRKDACDRKKIKMLRIELSRTQVCLNKAMVPLDNRINFLQEKIQTAESNMGVKQTSIEQFTASRDSIPNKQSQGYRAITDTITKLTKQKEQLKQDYIRADKEHSELYGISRKIKIAKDQLNAFFQLRRSYDDFLDHFEDIQNEREKWGVAVRDLVASHQLSIDSVSIEFNDGVIKNIFVSGKFGGKWISFANLVPISFTSITNYDMLDKKYLFELFEKNYRLNLASVIKYLPELNVDAEDYSPSDSVYKFHLGDEPTEVHICYKEKRSDILDARIYTDFIGYGPDQPNGMIQFDITKKIPLYTRRNPMSSHRMFFSVINFYEPQFTFAKLDGHNRWLAPADVNGISKDTTGKIIDTAGKKYTSTIDIYKYSYIRMRPLYFNFLNLEFQEIATTIELNLAFSLFVTPIRDSINNKVSEWTALSGMPYGEIRILFKPDVRYGFDLSANAGWLFLWDKKLTQVEDFENHQTATNKKLLMNWQFNTFYKPFRRSENAFFFRVSNTFELLNMKQNYLQIQLGYAFNIFKK